MSLNKLADLFSSYAFKYLSAVDCNPAVSRQHEIGSNKLKKILGDPGDKKIYFKGKFIYLGQDQDDCFSSGGTLTFYDSRARQTHRGPEYRLYYSDNIVTEMMQEGDFLLLVKLVDGSLLFLVTPKGTSTENRVMNLLGIKNITTLELKAESEIPPKEVSFVERYILEEIGIETKVSDETYLNMLLNKFQGGFPSTGKFSAFAREIVKKEYPDIDYSSPDIVFSLWIEKEEILFKTFEEYFVSKKINEGFISVEDFISYSLSVQNRRKSRAGLSLENHLEKIFRSKNIQYSRGQATENNSKPDFIFPGIKEYFNKKFPAYFLTMLGVKSSCKDRWRQILVEAERIPHKHLFTLEPSISLNQTNEMKYHKLKLVLPEKLHRYYLPSQKNELLTLGEFLEILEYKKDNLIKTYSTSPDNNLRVASGNKRIKPSL